MRPPPRLRSERLDRWAQRLAGVRGLDPADRLAISEVIHELHVAWRDELALELPSETTCAHGFITCDECSRVAEDEVA